MDSVDSSSYLHFPQSFFQAFADCSKRQQLLLVSPLLSCFTAFSALKQDPSICRSVFFFHFTLWSAGIAKFSSWQVLFLLIKTGCGLLTGIIFLVRLWFGHWAFVNMVKFYLLHNSQWITSPIQLCLVFFASLLYLLDMWLTISSVTI